MSEETLYTIDEVLAVVKDVREKEREKCIEIIKSIGEARQKRITDNGISDEIHVEAGKSIVAAALFLRHGTGAG